MHSRNLGIFMIMIAVIDDDVVVPDDVVVVYVVGWLNNFSVSDVQLCSNNSDCDQSSGLICFQMYEGCPLRGQCMCNSPSRLLPTNDDINARCAPGSIPA